VVVRSWSRGMRVVAGGDASTFGCDAVLAHRGSPNGLSSVSPGRSAAGDTAAIDSARTLFGV